MSEVKGQKDWQKKDRGESSEERGKRPDIKKQTFTVGDLLIEVARVKMDQLFDNAIRGGRR